MKDLSVLTDEELKELHSKILKLRSEYENELRRNKELTKINEQLEKIDKQLDAILDLLNMHKHKTVSLVTSNGQTPYFYYGEYGKETNIKPIVFKAIRKAGFRTSLLKDTQITKFAQYVVNQLLNMDEEYKKLKQQFDLLSKQKSELLDRKWQVVHEIYNALLIKYKLQSLSLYEVKKEIERRKSIAKLTERQRKKMEKREQERRKFLKSFQQIFNVFKEMLESQERQEK